MGVLVIDDSRAADGLREAVVTVAGERHRLFIERLDGGFSAGCADAFVLGSIAVFMHRREPMRIEAPVTRRLLSGLEEWQRAWSRWSPATYAAIDVTAEEVLVGYPTSASAVTAFTGGVDSTYTVHRHQTGAAENATADLRAAVFVHGFDIPLEDVEGFEASAAGRPSSSNDQE